MDFFLVFLVELDNVKGFNVDLKCRSHDNEQSFHDNDFLISSSADMLWIRVGVGAVRRNRLDGLDMLWHGLRLHLRQRLVLSMSRRNLNNLFV